MAKAKKKRPVDDGVPPAFLTPDPPHWAGRGLAYILIALFIVVTVCAVVVETPETVSSPFVLVPIGGTDPVRAPRSGRVVSVNAVEGQDLAKGAPLFVLSSEQTGDRTALRQTLEAEVAGAQQALENAREQYESRRRGDEQEVARLKEHRQHIDRMISYKEEQLRLREEVVKGYEAMHEGGLVGDLEYADRQLRANQTRMEIAGLRTDHQSNLRSSERLSHEAAARESELRELERSLTEHIETHRIKITTLEAQLSDSDGSQFTVFAACAGTLLRTNIRAPGAVVGSGEVLCELACREQRLQAELRLPESAISRVRLGQGVKLLYDAFPYQRHGVKFGALRWISPASVSIQDRPVFRALVDLDEQTVTVKGDRRTLIAGLGGRADVVVGRRTWLSYAFEPLRQLRENMVDAPPRPEPPPES